MAQPRESRVLLPLSSGAQLTCHAPNTRLDWHRHPEAYATLLINGSYDEECDAGTKRARPGDVIVHPPGTYHRNSFGPRGALCLDLNLDALSRTRALSAVGATSQLLPAAETGLTKYGARVLAGDLDIAQLVAHITRELNRGTRASTNLADNVHFYLEQHFRSRIRLADLARVFARTPEHIARSYQRRHGATVGTMIRRLRVRWAVTQLVEGHAPIAAIVYDAGFSDHAQMTRAVRRETGRTPSSLREYPTGQILI